MSQQVKLFERAALAASSVMLAILFVLLLVDVILRWLRIEFFWGGESGGILMAWMIFLALPIVMRNRSHLAADFLTSSLSGFWSSALRVAGHVLMLVYLIILTWTCAELAFQNWLGGTRSQGILRIPVWIVEAGVVFSFCIMVLSQLTIVIEEVRGAINDTGTSE